MKKKHFFRKNFSQNCENHPIFGVRNAALKKKALWWDGFRPAFFKKPILPSIVSYACITFSASWVALCCWGSPSPRRCAPVRPPHGGAFAPSGRALTGVGACPCKRRKKRLHAYASEAIVHPTDTCRFSHQEKFLYTSPQNPLSFLYNSTH